MLEAPTNLTFSLKYPLKRLRFISHSHPQHAFIWRSVCVSKESSQYLYRCCHSKTTLRLITIWRQMNEWSKSLRFYITSHKTPALRRFQVSFDCEALRTASERNSISYVYRTFKGTSRVHSNSRIWLPHSNRQKHFLKSVPRCRQYWSCCWEKRQTVWSVRMCQTGFFHSFPRKKIVWYKTGTTSVCQKDGWAERGRRRRVRSLKYWKKDLQFESKAQSRKSFRQ